MISVNKKGIGITGTMNEIFSDLTNAMHYIREIVEGVFDKEEIDEILHKMVDMSGMDVEELIDENVMIEKF